MKNPRLHSSFLLAAALALGFLATARADEAPTTIKFSDPSKPGTVKVNLGHGELHIQGTDTNEVSVKTDAKAVPSKPRKDGLRLISTASSFALTEKENVVVIDGASNDWGRGSGDFRLTVPRNTSITVQNAWGGDITCAGINGDIDISSMHGEVRLDDVAGGVVVGTMNGEIRASIRELHDGKPLSFTSMSGEVVIRLPENAKANVRLRTQNGSVLTDFSESALVTKTETTAGMPSRGRAVFKSKDGKVLTVEIQDAIIEATKISATAVREALEAVKAGLESSKLDADEARKELDDARKQMAAAKAEADRQNRNADRERRTAAARAGRNADATPTPAPAAPPTPEVAAIAPMPPMPAKMTMPTISGGKLVTGTLNGGGPEISVSTMNGDVTIRQLEKK